MVHGILFNSTKGILRDHGHKVKNKMLQVENKFFMLKIKINVRKMNNQEKSRTC